MTGLIPSSTNIFNTQRNATILGVQNLRLTDYGNQTIPYHILAKQNFDGNFMERVVKSVYSNRPEVNLVRLKNNTVNDYVFEKRLKSWKNFVNDYFVGFRIDMRNQFEPQMTVYYSTLAYHSSANILHDMNNLLLRYMTNDENMSITTYNAPLASYETYTTTTNNLQDVLACLDTLPLSLINFFNSLIVSFTIAIVAIHVCKERINGSKQLQLLSGTHYGTYWLSNFLFDWPIFFLTAVSLVVVLKVINSIKNDPSNELYAIAGDSSNLGYFFLLLFFSSFSWCTYAYIWSFFFKSDIVSFILLFLVLAVVTFFYDVLTFVQVLFVDYSSRVTFVSASMSLVRLLLVLIFPNLTIMRGMYDLKIRNNKFCIAAVNKALAGLYQHFFYKFFCFFFELTDFFSNVSRRLRVLRLCFGISRAWHWSIYAFYSNSICSKFGHTVLF